MQLLIGTYTRHTKSEGIYRVELETDTGALKDPALALQVDNPSFLCADDSTLAVVSEISDSEASGEVLLFDRSRGKLDLAQVVSSRGADPCHIAMTPSHIAVANYSGGTAALFERDGSRLKDDPIVLRHSKHGPHPRQEGPHPHGVYFINEHLWVPDLGGDCVEIYGLNGNHHQTIELPKGSGPRHLTGNGRYCIGELDNSVYDLEQNAFESSLPEGFQGESIAAEILLHDDQLYVSNRGHDSIARLETNPELKFVESTSSGGEHPRHFTIVEGWMVIANKDSHHLCTRRILDGGRLGDIASEVECFAPTCILAT